MNRGKDAQRNEKDEKYVETLGETFLEYLPIWWTSAGVRIAIRSILLFFLTLDSLLIVAIESLSIEKQMSNRHSDIGEL